ncbi:hypothetical protein [Planococcus glaciei]|uniref:hypothetical protein n=1 Tax=Planococcus glaciei TaxID=459472 RepID=UPI001C73B7EC|nr:hypothetical protein [Planococcus glaciei]MBX0314154.1 hypothetical protein [Planococcus glaciei]
MEGVVCLIRISADRIVPALYLMDENESYSFAQIRKANNEDRLPLHPVKQEKVKSKKGRLEEKQLKVDKKNIIDSVYIGQPIGLKSASVVMLKKVHVVKSDSIIKQIATVPVEDFKKCLLMHKEIKRTNDLHQQLHKIKKKIQLAQYNNEKYGDLEKQKDQILKEIGYSNQPLVNKEKKPYLNFREVPNKGRIKVYKGGR